MTSNKAKAILRDGGTAIGTMITEARSEEIGHVLAAAGFDFFVIDTEHSTATLEAVQRISRAARSAGITPLVRIPAISYPLIARTLDAGPLGLMVPHVESADDAREIVRCAKYPPAGERGYGLRGAVTDYSGAALPDAMAWSNAETLLMAQVESERCLRNLDEIASVPGIDVLLVGPTDLSISLGVPGQLQHPKMQEAYRQVGQAAERHKIAAGLHPSDIKVVALGRDLGMRCLMYSTDVRLLLDAARQALTILRTGR